MHRRDNLQFILGDQVVKDLAFLLKTLGSQLGVRGRHLLHEVPVLRGMLPRSVPVGLDRRLDVPQQLGELAEFRAIDGALDRAAFAVAQHDDELRPGQLGRELGTANDVVVDKVASHANAEDVADALIEDQLVVPILFTWPSRGSVLAYGYDRESTVYSRNALESLLKAISRDPAMGEISIPPRCRTDQEGANVAFDASPTFRGCRGSRKPFSITDLLRNWQSLLPSVGRKGRRQCLGPGHSIFTRLLQIT
jgi:hypothetical protein